jgi:hypothetical protein
LFNTACERQGLVRGEDYRVDYRPLPNGRTGLAYFTKYGCSHEVILFQTGFLIRKFYVIGEWLRTSKKQLWQECIQRWYGKPSDPVSISEFNVPDAIYTTEVFDPAVWFMSQQSSMVTDGAAWEIVSPTSADVAVFQILYDFPCSYQTKNMLYQQHIITCYPDNIILLQ